MKNRAAIRQIECLLNRQASQADDGIAKQLERAANATGELV